VEKVGDVAKNIFHLMFITMVTLQGLNVEKLGVNFISMDCDGNNVLQNVKVSVSTQIKENLA
jgi:tartrate dehydratase beta subunit/fumarate hydratase class I family protein